MKHHRLSLCMIVRDEEDVLAAALDSVRSVVDEIVVVDTGSEDETPTIARRYGAHLIFETWRDDFSRARNVALDAATADWILILDADERVDREDLGRVTELVSAPPDRAYTFRQLTYLDHGGAAGMRSAAAAPPPYSQWCGYVEARQTRLFPARSSLRYEGRVHEEIASALGRSGVESVDASIVIHHLGKVRDEHRRRRKRELYLRLAQSKVAERGDGPSAFELGVALVEVGEVDSALEILLKAVPLLEESGPRAQCVAAASRAMCRLDRSGEAVAYLYEQLPSVATVLPVWEALADVHHRQGQHDLAVTILHRALPLFPDQLQLWALLGKSYLALHQFDLAARSFERWHALGGRTASLLQDWAAAAERCGMTGPPIERPLAFPAADSG